MNSWQPLCTRAEPGSAIEYTCGLDVGVHILRGDTHRRRHLVSCALPARINGVNMLLCVAMYRV